MAYAAVSNTAPRKWLRVRIPPSAPAPWAHQCPARLSSTDGSVTWPSAVAAAVLKAADILDRDITILRGDEGASRFDPTGAIHGFFTRLRRIVSFTVMDQLPDMAWYDAAIRAGQAVIMVHLRGDERKAEAIRILREHGGHFINYYGRFATEEIVRWQGPDPDVHDLLKR
jgi:hypothetical protein